MDQTLFKFARLRGSDPSWPFGCAAFFSCNTSDISRTTPFLAARLPPQTSYYMSCAMIGDLTEGRGSYTCASKSINGAKMDRGPD